MIQFHCAACGNQLSLPESFAGKTGKCKQCQAPLRVPNLSDAGQQPAPVASTPVVVTQSTAGKTKTRWPLVAAAGALVLLTTGAVAYVFYAQRVGPNSETQAPTATRAASTPAKVDWLRRGKDAIAAKDYDLAITCLREALKQEANPAPVYVELGHCYTHKGQPAQAIANFTEAIKSDPKAVEAYVGRARAYAANNEHQQGSAEIRRAEGAGATRQLLSLAAAQVGLDCGQRKQWKEAVSYLTLATEYNPQDPETYWARHVAYAGMKLFERAAEDADRAVELGHRLTPEERVSLALVYTLTAVNLRLSADQSPKGETSGEAKAEFTKAADYCAKAVKLDPSRAQTYFVRGYCLLKLGRREEAVTDLRKATQLDPSLDKSVTFLLGQQPQPR